MFRSANGRSSKRAAIHPAYVLGLGAAGLSAVRSLGRSGVPVVGVDSRPGSAGMFSRFCWPKTCPSPIHQQDELLSFFRQEANRLDVPGILFPCNDEFSLFVSRHRAELEPNFRFAVPSRDVIESMVDKWKQHWWAEKSGVPCPHTYYPKTMEDIREIQGELDFPVLVKPRFGHLWREHFPCKGFKADDAIELSAIFKKVYSLGLQAIIQSIICGPATNMYSFVAYLGEESTPIAEFTQRKIRQLPHDFGVGTMVESCDCPELSVLGMQFLKCLRYRGIAEIEFKRDDRDGKFKLIELNTRFWLQLELAQSCGVNFPLVQYRDLCGYQPEFQSGFTKGVRWLDGLPDFWCSLALYRSGKLPLYWWLRSWLGSRSFATLAFDDPKPFIKTVLPEIGNVGNAYLGKARTRLTRSFARYATRPLRGS
jgi:D-aspartate ligase